MMNDDCMNDNFDKSSERDAILELKGKGQIKTVKISIVFKHF